MVERPEWCQHNEFSLEAGVGRLSRDEGGPITHYCADIKVSCAECGLEFEWRGVSPGMNAYEPRVSIDGLELRIPIMPPGKDIPKGLVGFEIRVRPTGANDDG